MSFSSYLDNMMRHGRSTYNASLRFTTAGGSEIECKPYASASFQPAIPLLVRFPDAQVATVDTGVLLLDITESFGLGDDVVEEWIYVGLQRINNITMQLCVGLTNPGAGDITTVTSSPSASQILAPTAVTGPIKWFATLARMKRVGGVWDSTDADISYGE